MKNRYITYAILLVLALVLSVSNVFAVASFTADDITFEPAEGQRGENVTQQLKIVNTGTEALTLSIISSLPSAYKAVIDQASVDVAIGASVDVPVTLYVPLSQDSGTETVSGGLTVTATNVVGLSDNVGVSITTASMLEISKVQLEIDGDKETLSNGESYDEDLRAGTSVNIVIKVSNEFNSADDYEIQDIEVEIEGDGDLDLDESDDLSDLDQGDDDTITFTFDIPSDAEDGDDYDIDITVTGEDENGAFHEDKFSANLEVSRERHEIAITDVTFNPSGVVECSGKVTMNIDIENTGKYDEDNVNIVVVSQGLDIEQAFYVAEFDNDEDVRKSFTFDIDEDVKSGDYDFAITSYYDVDEMSDVEVVTLTVEECGKSTTTTQPGTTTTNPTQPTIPSVVPTSGATPVYGAASFTDSPVYVIILAAAVIVLLLILIILVVKFVF